MSNYRMLMAQLHNQNRAKALQYVASDLYTGIVSDTQVLTGTAEHSWLVNGGNAVEKSNLSATIDDNYDKMSDLAYTQNCRISSQLSYIEDNAKGILAVNSNNRELTNNYDNHYSLEKYESEYKRKEDLQLREPTNDPAEYSSS